MTDLVIRNARLVDGSGAPERPADVVVASGRVASVEAAGRASTAGAARVIDADGLLVTPGFVDVHTHYDAQVTWDPYLSPSTDHGVTTVVMGNCGVGFAPAKPADHELLVRLMEGVEDIPDVVMTEGVPWNWETFPDYLDALERRSFAVDVGAHRCQVRVGLTLCSKRGRRVVPDEVDAVARLELPRRQLAHASPATASHVASLVSYGTEVARNALWAHRLALARRVYPL